MKKKVIRFLSFVIIVITVSASLFIKDKTSIESPEKYTNIFEIKTNKTENYLFFGDSVTKYYPIDDFFEDLPTVNSGTEEVSLEEMKDNTHDLVSIYNPTHIIIEVGLDEIKETEKDETEIYNEIIDLIKQIKKDKPKAKLYLESIYPTRELELNEKIKNINKKLKEYSNNKNITYIDIYSHLLEDDLLKEEYSDDDYLTENAYARISTHIRRALKNTNNSDYDNVYSIDNKENEKIVFIGDSLTDLYPINDYFENINIINNGVSGYTTTDILDNIQKMVYDEKPTKVFINIGINDMCDTERNQDEIYDNITKIIKEIKKENLKTQIYIQSIYPMNTSDDQKIKRESVESRSMEEIQYINKKLKERYKGSNVTYIDVYNKLLDKDKMLKLSYTVDGVHISNCGYSKISEVLIPYIAE